uniref:F-box domain-containing protein n=1 Tax=Nelumbo nucifera TaxID=4432 RepID=A0A822ZFM1_NELNU|nr:TPA_asm: hypothetical protein HUJ06_002152 [Nelumbo nucifera]
MVFISVLLQYLGVSCSSFGLLEDLEKKTIKNEKNKTNPWCSELPDDIIELILRRLDVLDYIRFYSVCKLWRSVAVGMDLGYSLCCRGLPWLMFTCDAKTQTYGFFSLSESRKYYIPLPTAGGLAHCCGSSQGWLLMCNSASGGCFLLNPFSGAEIKLPRLSPPLAYKTGRP